MQVWVDRLSLIAGDDWEESIAAALERASHFVIVLSPDSISSPEVRSELRVALDEQIRVIPILYRACRIPRRLRLIQYVDFTGGDPLDPRSTNQLLKALDASKKSDARTLRYRRFLLLASQLALSANIVLVLILLKKRWFNLTAWSEVLSSLTGLVALLASVLALVAPYIYQYLKDRFSSRAWYSGLFLNEKQQLRKWHVALSCVLLPVVTAAIIATPDAITIRRARGESPRLSHAFYPHSDLAIGYEELSDCHYIIDTFVGRFNRLSPESLIVGLEPYGAVQVSELWSDDWRLDSDARIPDELPYDERHIEIALSEEDVRKSSSLRVVLEYTTDRTIPEGVQLYAYFDSPRSGDAWRDIGATMCN